MGETPRLQKTQSRNGGNPANLQNSSPYAYRRPTNSIWAINSSVNQAFFPGFRSGTAQSTSRSSRHVRTLLKSSTYQNGLSSSSLLIAFRKSSYSKIFHPWVKNNQFQHSLLSGRPWTPKWYVVLFPFLLIFKLGAVQNRSGMCITSSYI
jgi:hypothetical protein